MSPTIDSRVAELESANAELRRQLDARTAELEEALARQNAIAEVLQVINSSPGDPAAVFDAILEKAHALCGVSYGSLHLYDGERFRAAAVHSLPEQFAALLRQGFRGSDTPWGRPLVAGAPRVQIADFAELDHPMARAVVELGGIRTALFVPLRKDDALLGMIVSARREVRPFAEKDIALLENFAGQAVIAIDNARLMTETREALEQQTAAAEVLQVINASPGDLAPVFEVIFEKARSVCGSHRGGLLVRDGEQFRAVALHGIPEAFAELLHRGFAPGGPNTPIGRLIDGAHFFHVPDLAEIAPRLTDDPIPRAAVELGGMRTMLMVPLRKEDALLGTIVAARQEVCPFSDKQIALLQNFAAQAVIAMKNARLLTETRELLEQQTATAEVLQIINSSPGDLAPVFEAILEKAHGLCGIACGTLQLNDGGKFRAVAVRGVAEPLAELLRQPAQPIPGLALSRILRGERIVQITDLAELAKQRPDDPRARASAEYGLRTELFVPLRRDGDLLGYISASRREVRPFAEKEIALLENFAAQAVIAMENARLLTETREALDQQTATAELLQVINSSPGDLAPVFAAMLEKATRLCQAAFGLMRTFDGEGFGLAAFQGVPEAFAEWLKRNRPEFGPGTAPGPLRQGERVVHVVDLADTEAYRAGEPNRRAIVELGGAGSMLTVPLRKDEALFGSFTIYRQEVRPFTDKHIALLENFAAQAVIAMENARLLTETREALEQQTATAEVLQVINSSPGNLAPVFDAMLEKAMRLCEASFGAFLTFDGEFFHAVAERGVPAAMVAAAREPIPITPGGMLVRIANGEPIVHVDDLTDTEAYRCGSRSLVALANIGGARAAVWVALRREEALLGVLVIYRQEVRPFTDKQIALLQNFAAQAVIAMENARLVTETREALEQQTATAEVLQVINSSPGNLAPVFDAMLEKAMYLCDAASGTFFTREGELARSVAFRNTPIPYAEFWTNEPVQLKTIFGPNFLDGPIVHISDLRASGAYRQRIPLAVAAVELGGIRTFLALPLIKDGTLIGGFVIYRQEVRPFAEKEIALLQSFAAQAVIAMENARLLTETREALEQQTATAEVLQVINSSPGKLAPVFDAMLERAMELCGAAFGLLGTWQGDRYENVAARGVPQPLADFLAANQIWPGPRSGFARAARTEGYLQSADLSASKFYERGEPLVRAMVDLGGTRTMLIVPLARDDEVLGLIGFYRQEVRPFSDRQFAVLKNFAAQAVIAIENARLLTETREALEQQTATSEVLQVINSSPGDLAPIFDAMLEKAVRLCGGLYGNLWTLEGERANLVASREMPPEVVELLRQQGELGNHPLLRRVIGGEHLFQFDLAEHDIYRLGHVKAARDIVAAGVRRQIWVAMVKDGAAVGTFVISRREVQPFSDKEIALLQNFAAQAVIAMENARLLNDLETRTRDLQESLEYQTATSDVLKVISRSAADLDPVLDTLVGTAARICEADMAQIYTMREGFARYAAAFGSTPEFDRLLSGRAIAPGRQTLVGRTMLERRVVCIDDAANDPDYWSEAQRIGRIRTGLGVPLLREDALIGVICLARSRVEPFTERQIELVRTFADQAVIAIENARLLNDLEARTRDLQESLEYQTATSDVLKVISRSTLDLDAVLETVVTTALRLCRADSAVIYRKDGGEYRWAAGHMLVPDYEELERAVRIRPGTGTAVGRAAMEGRSVQILDAWTDPLYEAKEDARVGGVHTMIGVPLLRENAPIGVIGLARRRIEAFSEGEIQLVTTFADQAVIAIENARLFDELRKRTADLGRSVDELRLLNEVGRAVSSTLDLSAVLATILGRSVTITGADAGAVFRYSRAERAFRLVEAAGLDDAFARRVRDLRVAEAETVMTEAAARRTPIQLADLATRPKTPLVAASLAAGVHSALIVPLVGPERILGAISLMRKEAGEFPPETVRLMQTLASQSVLAIQNARLYREIAEKSEQLALASAHKSQFLANMSHELRTPLNAILGYAELLVDGIYGVLPARAQDVLERVQNNGKHLLALINDVLDLAKIEAGQLTLTLEDYNLPELVRAVVAATEPLAAAKGLKFVANVQEGMPLAHGDARRVSQVLLNLVGNAVKFTDAGEVEINASAEAGQFVLTVRDTGPGIAEADQERIFGEFQQIDTANTRKQGGTGLGLAISKRMVEMQGGLISVELGPRPGLGVPRRAADPCRAGAGGGGRMTRRT